MRKTGILVLGCALAIALPTLAMADPVILVAELNGASETKGGDPDGSGTFWAEFDSGNGDVCYILNAENISEVVAVHLHKGAAGADGKKVLILEMTGVDEDICIAAEPDKLEPVELEPASYYVNIHTTDFPKGAVRGQLAKSAE